VWKIPLETLGVNYIQDGVKELCMADWSDLILCSVRPSRISVNPFRN